MDHGLQYSPFVSVSDSNQQLLSDGDGSLDHLGESTAGELYWNGSLASLGLICGSSENETSAIIQRIMASHMGEPKAQVLVLHTDHFSIRGGPCSLLNSTWGRTIVLVSPYAANRVIRSYDSDGILVAPIVFKETSITLRHILELFTPPEKMRGASSIISTLGLVLSQLEEPFDLQRFIELVDQEEWSQEGVNFIALRQTLLTKLLSPVPDTVYEGTKRRIALVDLTDPILLSTGLDSAIMDIALCDFIRSGDGRKMIVLNNCQQYLTHNSHLTRSLEAIAALGSDRPTRIILSTTEPNFVSSPLLNSLDYVVLGSTRSLVWSAFLRKHFAIDSAKQSRRGRAMIWSPESTSLVHNSAEDTLQKLWNDDLVWIEIAKLKQSMPTIPPDLSLARSTVHGLIPNGAKERAAESQATKEAAISPEISHEYKSGGGQDDDEEGIVSLDKLGLDPSSNPPADDQPPLSESNAPNEALPAVTVAEESKPTETPSTVDPIQIFAKFEPLIACISRLGGANVGSQVEYKSIKEMMAGRDLEIIGLGWQSFGHMIDSAYQAGFLKPVKNKPKGKTKLLELLVPLPHLRPVGPGSQPADPTYIPSTPPDLTQVVPTIAPEHAESKQDPPLNCPLKHRPVVSAIVALADGSTAIKVRLVDLTNSLLRNHRGAEVVVAPLIREAIDDGIILQEKENAHLTWVWLNNGTKGTNHPRTTPTLPPNLGKVGSPKPAAHMRSGQLDALTCPLKHIPVFSTMLELTGGEVGVKVRLIDLSNSLLLNHRGADVVVGPLILEAKEDGILVQAKDSAGVLWVWINDTDTLPLTSPGSLPTHLPQPAVGVNNAPSPPPTSKQTTPNRITTASCPPRHRAVVAALITLTDGTPGKKVRMVEWMSSLRCEYPGAREEFLLSLIAKAEEDGVVTRGRGQNGQNGVQWAWLNPEKGIQTAPVGPDFRLEPERQEGPVSPTVDNYPVAHRAVVSVIKSMNGRVHTEVSVGSVCEALCDRKYASTSQGAMNMIAAARTAKVIRVSGEQILLEDPGLSRDGFLSAI